MPSRDGSAGVILDAVLAYRTDEDAARLVAEQLEQETADLWRENVALATKLARTEVARDAALQRLADAGPEGGRPSARRDRIGLGAIVLALAGLALLPLEVLWFPLVRTNVTILPVIALLGVPGVMAAWVGYRYRRVSLASRVAFVLGVGVALSAVFEIVLGASP